MAVGIDNFGVGTLMDLDRIELLVVVGIAFAAAVGLRTGQQGPRIVVVVAGTLMVV